MPYDAMNGVAESIFKFLGPLCEVVDQRGEAECQFTSPLHSLPNLNAFKGVTREARFCGIKKAIVAL